MKLYMAGPLFTAAEKDFNARLSAVLRDMGHEVFLPQESEEALHTARQIFLADVAGIDWADVVVACMDGADPDSGTCWEVGYAYKKKPILLYRTDFRSDSFPDAPYNLMLTESADCHVHMLDNVKDPVAFLATWIDRNAVMAPRPRRNLFGGLTLRVAEGGFNATLIDEHNRPVDGVTAVGYELVAGQLGRVTLVIEATDAELKVVPR